MNKKTTKQFYEYYNKWVSPFASNKGDNLLESEGQLYSLINSAVEEERERCVLKVVELELPAVIMKAIAKAIRGSND